MSNDITVADAAQLGVEQVYWHLRQNNKTKWNKTIWNKNIIKIYIQKLKYM